MDEFFPLSVALKIPATAPLGSTHAVVVRNTATNRVTRDVNYKVVAPRNYRGYFG